MELPNFTATDIMWMSDFLLGSGSVSKSELDSLTREQIINKWLICSGAGVVADMIVSVITSENK